MSMIQTEWLENCASNYNLFSLRRTDVFLTYQKRTVNYPPNVKKCYRLTVQCNIMMGILIVINEYTGYPKKHGNSVTNSISSFQIIL